MNNWKIWLDLHSVKGISMSAKDKRVRSLLITSSCFSNLMSTGKHQREQLLNNNSYPKFDKVIEIEGSIDNQGNVIIELSESKINILLREVFKFKADIILIAFLNSNKNPLHEKTIFNLLKTAGIKNVFASYLL